MNTYTLARICDRCLGSGFVNVKHGGVKPCPFCDHGQTRRAQTRPIAPQGRVDVRDVILGLLLYALITAMAVVGHSWVSVRVAHGQMPGLQVELYLAKVSK